MFKFKSTTNRFHKSDTAYENANKPKCQIAGQIGASIQAKVLNRYLVI